jgi:two-component system, cell cycle response regulator
MKNIFQHLFKPNVQASNDRLDTADALMDGRAPELRKRPVASIRKFGIHAREMSLKLRRPRSKLLSPFQVTFRISLILAAAQVPIVLSLLALPTETGIFTVAVIDALMLAVLSIAPIYIWVIRPFVRARDEAFAQISYLAHTDALTSLANRRLISRHLAMLIAACARHRSYGAVLMLDLDGFKHINDLHGHKMGDALLVGAAARIQNSVRSEDVAGRVGGDEFVVLVHRLGSVERIAREGALRMAEDLIKTISQQYEIDGKTLEIGASVGIRMVGFDGVDADMAMVGADVALYRAKQDGKKRAVFYE